MEVTFSNFHEFADWIHKSEKHREELEQDNYELQRENLALRSEKQDLQGHVDMLKKQIKNATAANSDETIFNIDSIPQIFKGRDKNVK